MSREQAESFLSSAGGLLTRDEYGSYTICNIYLDTDDFRFIERSLDKPDYKEKLRIRSYGLPDSGADVFFEIKKKFGGIVYKRRIILPYREAMEYIETKQPPKTLKTTVDKQIFGEIDYLVRTREPAPKLYLAYDREAYRMDGDVRITLDRNIRYRWEDVTFEYGDCGNLLKTWIEDYRLLELKSGGAVPIEITRILSQNRIYPDSFSKYGRIYEERVNKGIRNGAVV